MPNFNPSCNIWYEEKKEHDKLLDLIEEDMAIAFQLEELLDEDTYLE